MSCPRFVLALLGVLIASAGARASDDPPAPSPRQARPPSFVVILGEGHGWSSLSVASDPANPASRNARVRTPNFERLARQGLRFARFYAASPRCTPSRAALLTGVNPAQLGMTFVGVGRGEGGEPDATTRLSTPRPVLELPGSTTTVAELLQGAGYATAHFGKWHLGRVDPARHGFDASDGATSNGGPENVENPHPKQLVGMTDRGLDFLRRQARADRPFYLQLSHYASRRAADASPEAEAAVRAWGLDLDDREFRQAAADWDLDHELGRLLDGLDELGLTEHTYVLFTTDHGSPGRNPPLDGGKGSVREGGLRVPLIVRGPGVAPGSTSTVTATASDLLPTIAELARAQAPMAAEVEGGSLVPLLTGGGTGIVRRPHDGLVVHFPHYDGDPLGPASALIAGDLKLIHLYETGSVRLFDVVADPAERHDLAADRADQAQTLDRRLTARLEAMGARLPVPNPAFDPAKAPAPTRERRGGQRPRGERRP